MKKRIQKYLAGEREGFSLVELIIVIAIMAILIGVIALAVIPNIQKSRESKDLTTLDNILSATNTAVASAKIKESGTFTISYDNSSKSYGDPVKESGFAKESAKFIAAFKEAMAGTISLGSGPVANSTITITINSGRIDVGVLKAHKADTSAKDDGTYVLCDRTDSDSGSGKQAYHSSN